MFWVPEAARWEVLRAQAKQPDIGPRIDAALVAIENDNEILRGKLDRRFGWAQLEPGRLGELVDLISTIGFSDDAGLRGDPIGKIYEYFLGQFALAEGKKGGEFLTPPSGVKLLVAVLAPHKGRVYDPCCGSGGMFVSCQAFVTSHGGRFDDISIYGQESNPTTWRLAAMNLAIRRFAADLGQEPADTFARDQHQDQRVDHIMANPMASPASSTTAWLPSPCACSCPRGCRKACASWRRATGAASARRIDASGLTLREHRQR